MKLTDGERLIVVMLADLMEGLKIDRELDPTLIKSLVCGGDEWAIKRKYSGMFPSEGPTEEVVSETTNILWMWDILEHRIADLDGEEAAEAAKWLRTKFAGFDGNNDPHYGVAQTLINDLGDFSHFKGRNLNSHSQATLPRYQQMYAKFDGHLQNGGGELSVDALRDICN